MTETKTPVPSQTSTSSPRSPAQLSGPDWKQSVRRAAHEFKTDKATLVSAGMAFYWFLAVFPAIIAAVGVLGLAHAGPSVVADIQRAIRSALPGSASDALVGAVKGASDKSSRGSLLATLIGLVLALSSASAGMVALQRGMDVAYDVAEERTLVAARLRALLLMALAAVLGGVATTLIVFGKPLGNGLGDHLPLGTGSVFVVVWTILRWVLGLGALSLLFASFYTFGPNRRSPRFAWVSPGGILATLVWLAGSLAFSFYVTSLNSYNKVYGSFSGVVVLLLWLYLSALAVVAGAELNAELERQGDHRRKRHRRRARHRDADAATTAHSGDADRGDSAAPTRSAAPSRREAPAPRAQEPAPGATTPVPPAQGPPPPPRGAEASAAAAGPTRAPAPAPGSERVPAPTDVSRAGVPAGSSPDRSAQDAWLSYGRAGTAAPADGRAGGPDTGTGPAGADARPLSPPPEPTPTTPSRSRRR
ncbi:MAG: YhjD/YihY/BrkB family envelope integrity protein [Acidimicrobiales bacterium]